MVEMTTKIHFRRILFFECLLTSMLLACSQMVISQTPAIQIELMAAKPSWSDKEFVGHAFVCISISLNSGVKEDCFGFYPRRGSKGFIGGPGVVNSEFAKNPTRFSRITASLKKSITEEQRRQIFRLIDDWNEKHYELTNQSCIDFVNSIAQKLGWQIPPRVQTDLPETFLEKLAGAN